MSNYNPIPPRVWSRVQKPCTFTVPGSDYTQSFIPLTGQTVSQNEADYETKQIYKGNILQYKGNSARFTKSQRYSQLARCAGPNRTKVFATQSQTYTNPNTSGLLRVGYQTYPYPNQIVGAPNNISGPFQYNVPNSNDCSGNSVQDGGTLVCGTFSNPCTGEIIKQGINPATICNPASASDVPGSSVLCWNNKVQTWFPRQRYFMNNSTDKWPVNYKGFVSAIQNDSPIILTAGNLKLKSITNITGTTGTATIQIFWSPPLNYCGTIYGYKIYIDNIFIDIVLAPITTYITTPLAINQTYNFNIVTISIINYPSGRYKIDSVFSSTLKVNLPIIYTTTGSPTSTFNSGSVMLKYISDELFTINYDLFMQYTLVGGGSGGGYWYFTVGTAAGGGGQVLNTNTYSIVSKNTFSLVVGVGGLGGISFSQGNGETGTDSSISGLGFNVSTNNNLYAGDGGRGEINYSYNGGGGPGGNIISANGGTYNTGPANGTGGAGGSLTIVNSLNMIISTTIGGQGQNTQASSGGSGGSGHQGIDLITYGGGGGGGAFPNIGNTGGLGGSGGGGKGAFNDPVATPAQDGQAPGGGGGGGCNNGSPPGPGLLPGNGANGIIIIEFTNPP
jgi:hypothetical protein